MIPSSIPSKPSEAKYPVFGNENNPNAINQMPGSYSQQHQSRLAAASLQEASKKKQLETQSAHQNSLNEENANVKPIGSAAAAVTHSISTRMRSALESRVGSIPSNSTGVTSTESSTIPSRESKPFSFDYTSSKETTAVSSTRLKYGSQLNGYNGLNAPQSAKPNVPKFDIYVDKVDEKPVQQSLSSKFASSEFVSTTLMSKSTTNQPATSANSSNRYSSYTIGKLQEDLQELKLREEVSSPKKVTVAREGNGKRAEGLSSDYPLRTPAEKYVKPKRVKEAWSGGNSNILKDNTKKVSTAEAGDDDMQLDDEPEEGPQDVPTVCTPPEQIVNADVLKNMRLGTLETMHDMLNDSVGAIERRGAQSSSNQQQLDSKDPTAKVWVVRYVDYTSKYGLGFLFNTGSAGVYFNDSTKIVLSPDGKVFQYIERRRRDSSFGSEHSTQKHLIDSYPPELQKKVTLLKHFRNYLIEQEKNSVAKDNANKGNPNGMEDIVTDAMAFKSAYAKDVSYPITNSDTISVDDDTELPFLKKWVRTKHAILFRLSNRTVQVVFYDRR